MATSLRGQCDMNTKERYSDIDGEPMRLFDPIEGYQKLPLLSLEESVEPLSDLIEDLPRRVWMAKENCQERSDSLTEDEAAAICLYTMEWKSRERSLYYQLNETLRSKERAQLIGVWLPYLKLVLTALCKLPSVKQLVWRGAKVDLSGSYKRGKKYPWWGFSSCTESIEVLQSKAFLGKRGTQTMFCIECENGKLITPYSLFPAENEILLLPGSYFEVSGTSDFHDGLHVIHVKEINPPYALIESPFAADQSMSQGARSGRSVERMKNNKGILQKVEEMQAKTTIIETTPKDNWQHPKTTTTSANKDDKKPLSKDIATTIDKLKLGQVDVLHLSGKLASKEDTMAIAEALKINKTLTELWISQNNISDQGAMAIAEALKINKTLTELWIYENNISYQGAMAIAEALKINKTLTELWISQNNISDQGAMAIAEALKIN
ncbi:unnamed protein product, partial [Didymodactylos carnosus]